MIALRQSWIMTHRGLLSLIRQPWWIAISLVQPIIWLLLYGALFKRVVDIPGFHSTSYIQFLVPGVVMMTALFGSGWGGMGLLNDIERGVVDRFLMAPVHRGSIIAGRILQNVISIVIQSIIIVVLALIVGASFPTACSASS